MHTSGRLLVVPAVLLTLAACANGTDGLLPGYYEEQAGGGELSGNGGAGGGDLSASSSSSSNVSVGSTGVGGSRGEGGDEGSNEGDGGEGGGGGGGAAAECDYAAPNTCTRAEELDAISGDDGAESVTVTGTTSKWFKIMIDDVDDEASSEHFRATLTSPPGMNFDLIVYQGTADAPDCFASGVRGQGTPESFYATWDDVPLFEDDLWFSIEVRHVEGTACGDDAKWTLTLLGNNAALTSP